MTEIDPALAHLYGDALAEDDHELEKLEILKISATRTMTLEELTPLDEGDLEEELDDHDLEELALLVGSRVWGPDGLPDSEAAELGLGHLEDGELVLNEVGRRVLRLLADKFAHREVGPDA